MAGEPLFPPVSDEHEFDARIRRDEALLAPGIREICARHGLPAGDRVRFAGGSLPVYDLGALVLKLFPPFDQAHFDLERAVLASLPDGLPLRAPRLEAAGTLDGWGYVLMERLPGRPLAEVWADVPPADRARLFRTFGLGLAALHALPTGAVRDGLDWAAFLAGQRSGCAERQRARGLGSPWVDLIPDFLDRHAPGPPSRLVLLHTEVMREHLLAHPGAHGWELTGLVDFEPAMAGDPEYEFASVGIFATCGDREALRTVLLAYGYAASDLGPDLQRRFLAHALLHRYSRLSWYFDRLPPGPGVATLEQLAAVWWAL